MRGYYDLAKGTEEAMRFPFFVIGFTIAVVASVVFGLAAGFETGKLLVLVLGVVIVVQLAYVALVAILAFHRKRSTQRRKGIKPKPHSTKVSPENDV